MSRHHVGVPILSGRPPANPGPSQSACRKCGKEFILIINRQRKCMHCGYGYCTSCTDYQAVVPRSGPTSGYDLVHVCAYCIEMLSITVLDRPQLRSLPLAKLRRYLNAYNIPVRNAIDKNDLVDAAVAARTPGGFLASVNEDYYRKHSVPSYSTRGASNQSSDNRNSSARGSPNINANRTSRSNTPFPRPDLDPNRREHFQETSNDTYSSRRAPNAPRSRTTSAPMNPGTARQDSDSGQPYNARSTSSSGRQSTPRSTSATRDDSHSRSSSHLPPPPMSTLVTLPRSSISALSIGTLKQVLWEARVRVPPSIVEKEELVERVWAIVEEERRKDNEGIDDGDFEEEHVEEMVDPESETHEYGRGTDHHYSESAGDHGFPSRPATPQPPTSTHGASTSPPDSGPRAGPRPHSRPTSTDHSGLCVVCQDEEACIAVVDCGHLAMCRECSDLVLASTRECPLCRTRIVTEGRLLRIFKT